MFREYFSIKDPDNYYGKNTLTDIKITLDTDYLEDVETKGYFPSDIDVSKRNELIADIQKLDLEPMTSQLFSYNPGLTTQEKKEKPGGITFFPYGNFAQWGMFGNSHYVSDAEEALGALKNGGK